MNWNRIALYTSALLLAQYGITELFGRWFAYLTYDLTGSSLLMGWASGGRDLGYLLWPFALFAVFGAHQEQRTWIHAGLVFALYAASQVLALHAATQMLLLFGSALLEPYASVFIQVPLILQPVPLSVLAAFAGAGTLLGKHLASRAEFGGRSAILSYG